MAAGVAIVPEHPHQVAAIKMVNDQQDNQAELGVQPALAEVTGRIVTDQPPPKITVATIEGVVMPRYSLRSMILKRSRPG